MLKILEPHRTDNSSVLSCCCTWFLSLQSYISILSVFSQCFVSAEGPYLPQEAKFKICLKKLKNVVFKLKKSLKITCFYF